MGEAGSLKRWASDFLSLAASGQVDEAFARYVDAQSFIHHNQYVRHGRDALKEAMKDSASRMPGRSFTVRMAIEEGDRVMTYSHIQMPGAGPAIAVVHIARVRAGRIVELWDVGQAIAEDSPNEQGMF